MRRPIAFGLRPHRPRIMRAPALAGTLTLLVVAAACGGGQATPTPGSPDSPSRLQPPPITTSVLPQVTPTPGTIASSTQVQPTPFATSVVTQAPLPQVDTSIHSVPLGSVVFDTFDGGFLRLSEADSRTIEQLRDFIRPIYLPRYDGPEGGDWLLPTGLVIGYVGQKAAYAYPVKMLNFHEMVNDEIDGVPVLITDCPLCASGVVFDRRVEGAALTFGNTSALYENDLVIYDHQTNSYWFQVGGEAIVGTLTGKRLVLLPSVTLPWQQWREMHPDTQVLLQDQGFTQIYSYEYDPFEGIGVIWDEHQFFFPVSKEKLAGHSPPPFCAGSVGTCERPGKGLPSTEYGKQRGKRHGGRRARGRVQPQPRCCRYRILT